MGSLRVFFAIVFSIALLAGSAVSQAAVVDVLTLDETRVGTSSNENGSVNFNFGTGAGYASVRNSLLNPGNFGAGGVLPYAVSILNPVPLLTAGALSLADVVVLSAYSELTAGEVGALNYFLGQGGGLLVFNNYTAGHIGSSVFGATPGLGTTLDPVASIADTSSPIIAGPFGTVTGNILAGWSMSFSDVGPYGSTALTNHVGPMGVTFDFGTGRAVAFTDEELFLNEPSVDGIAWAAVRDNSQLLFLNSFAYAASGRSPGAAIPEPASSTLLLLGLGAMALKRYRKNKSLL